MDEREDRAERARLVGRYVIGPQIGVGGMGVVHLGGMRGSHGFSRVVAIKRAHRVLLGDRDATKELIHEARLSSRIAHVNVASMLDVVEDAGEVLLVMEYIHGASIARVMTEVFKRGEEIPVDIAVSLAALVLRGLHAAHTAVDEHGQSLGLVHRDVSPGNVMIDVSGVPKLIDFGVAKAIGRTRVTATGEIKGKVAYMSPEQFEGNATASSDIYGASVVLWEMLTGRRMFNEADGGLDMMIARILFRDRESPEKYRAVLPAGLADIVLRGVSIAQEDRFPNALEMASALEAVVVPASFARIGEWMVPYVSDLLEERAALVSALEKDLGGDAAVQEETKTELQVSLPAAPRVAPVARPEIRARHTAMLGALAAVALLSALGATLAIQSKKNAHAGEVAIASVTLPSASAIPSAALEAAPAIATSEAPAFASAPAPGSASRAPAHRGAPASTCNPPFAVGADGVKHFRAECFRVR